MASTQQEAQMVCGICGRRSTERYVLDNWFPDVWDEQDREIGIACEYHTQDMVYNAETATWTYHTDSVAGDSQR